MAGARRRQRPAAEWPLPPAARASQGFLARVLCATWSSAGCLVFPQALSPSEVSSLSPRPPVTQDSFGKPASCFQSSRWETCLFPPASARGPEHPWPSPFPPAPSAGGPCPLAPCLPWATGYEFREEPGGGGGAPPGSRPCAEKAQPRPRCAGQEAPCSQAGLGAIYQLCLPPGPHSHCWSAREIICRTGLMGRGGESLERK